MAWIIVIVNTSDPFRQIYRLVLCELMLDFIDQYKSKMHRHWMNFDKRKTIEFFADVSFFICVPGAVLVFTYLCTFSEDSYFFLCRCQRTPWKIWPKQLKHNRNIPTKNSDSRIRKRACTSFVIAGIKWLYSICM